MGLGPWEIIIIFIFVLLIFGGKKLPELAKGLGEGIKEFKKATNDIKDEVDNAISDKNTKENPTYIWEETYKELIKKLSEITW